MEKLQFKHSIKISWLDLITDVDYEVSFPTFKTITLNIDKLNADYVVETNVMWDGEWMNTGYSYKNNSELTIICKVYPDKSLGESIDFIEIVYYSRMEDRERKLEQLGI